MSLQIGLFRLRILVLERQQVSKGKGIEVLFRQKFENLKTQRSIRKNMKLKLFAFTFLTFCFTSVTGPPAAKAASLTTIATNLNNAQRQLSNRQSQI